MRQTMIMLAIAASAATVATARVVDRYKVSFALPPTDAVPHAIPMGRPQPPGGPYAGNGDVTIMHTGDGSSDGKHTAHLDWQQWHYLSKNDMWGSDQV